MKRAAVVVALAGCGGAPAQKAPPPDPFADDPVAVMAGLEDWLTSASQVDLEMTTRTVGPLTLQLAGEVHVERERVSWIKLRGTQGDGPVTVKWSSITPIDPSAADTQPPTWADGLLIGLLRMGATHDWALVTGGEDPETGHGDIRSWVTYGDVAWKDGDPHTHTLVFGVDVLGAPTAEAELTLDDRGLPRHRDQVVHFSEGDLRVVEDYTAFDVRP